MGGDLDIGQGNNPLEFGPMTDMANEMESDISEKVWSVFGTAAHGVMEDAVNATESSDSVRLSEERLNVQVDDWKVSGAIDLQEVHASDGTVSISDFKVTPQRSNISHDYIVPNNTVVGYMGASHKQDIITNNSFSIRRGSSVNSNKLPDYNIIAYQCLRIFTIIF